MCIQALALALHLGQLWSLSGLLPLVTTCWMQGTLCPVLGLWEGISSEGLSHLPRGNNWESDQAPGLWSRRW